MVQTGDFSFGGLHLVGDTKNAVGSKATPVTVTQLPRLNTFSITLACIDYLAWGVSQTHTYPCAFEILVVIEGTINVRFITLNPDNKLITKTLNKGDLFIFPQGLICSYFQQNVGNTNAVAIAGLSSQNPGVITIGNAMFGSKRKISADILTKAFQTDKNVISQIQAKF